MDKMTAAYVAGIVDGEGCFTVQRLRNSFYGRLTIAQNDRPFLQWIQGLAGGGYLGEGNGAYRLEITAARLRAFLPLIRPYLRIKAAQAALIAELVDLNSQYKRGRQPDGSYNKKVNPKRQAAIAAEIKLLNRPRK